jgi:hypothetical protein
MIFEKCPLRHATLHTQLNEYPWVYPAVPGSHHRVPKLTKRAGDDTHVVLTPGTKHVPLFRHVENVYGRSSNCPVVHRQ